LDPVSAEVWENKEVASGIFRLKLRPYGPAPRVAPGRFFMLGVGQGLDPLLRRPLGHLCTSVDDNGIHLLEFLYEVRGRGTRILSLAQPPRIVSFIGPLGRGWRLEVTPKRIMMVAGGMGVVPLYAAASALQLARPRPRVEFFFGAKTGRGLVLQAELEKRSTQFHPCTEDGCRGDKGLVTDLIKAEMKRLGEELERHKKEDKLILACGPRAMLKEVVKLARTADVPCQVSLEARMGCGMGACLTCSIKGADGNNLRVCQDGPVFAAEEVDWEALDESA